jgi:FtsH-binding integral membrane protein
MRVLFCVFFVSQSINGEVPSLPMLPTRYTLQTIVLYFYFVLQVFLSILCTFYLFKYVLPPVLFTLTQVVLLSITSTFTRVQIQSNVGTTADAFDISS